MNGRGFTLIELTAVVIILAAIFLVSFPSLLNLAKYDKEKQYENMINDLCLAGKTYIYSNMDKFEQLSTVGSSIEINISELILYGSVEKGIKNIKTGNLIDNDLLTFIVLNDNSLDCKYNY